VTGPLGCGIAAGAAVACYRTVAGRPWCRRGAGVTAVRLEYHGRRRTCRGRTVSLAVEQTRGWVKGRRVTSSDRVQGPGTNAIVGVVGSSSAVWAVEDARKRRTCPEFQKPDPRHSILGCYTNPNRQHWFRERMATWRLGHKATGLPCPPTRPRPSREQPSEKSE